MLKVCTYNIEDRRCHAHSYEDSVPDRKYGSRFVQVWYYEAAMISTFPGVFDDCNDNYEVEDRLRRAGVIRAKNVTDSETCALVVRFSNETSAAKFGQRLEKYIAERSPKKAEEVYVRIGN